MLSKEWIGGFISGEGCFTFINSTPIFQITLSKKDKQILYDIKNYLQLGRVILGINACFYVSKYNNCLELIKILDGHIYGDKLIDYENWKLGINFILVKPKKESLSKQDKEFIHNLKPRQNKIRKLFIKKDVPEHIKIRKKCINCQKNFDSNRAKNLRCIVCRKKHLLIYNKKSHEIKFNYKNYYKNYWKENLTKYLRHKEKVKEWQRLNRKII